MSLHQQLLDLVGEYRTSADADDYPVRFPLDALRAVVELHAPVKPFGTSPQLDCHGCGQAPMARHRTAWPCPTVQAIARELGIEAS